MIYAVIVNELGLAGAAALLLVYLLFVARGLKTAVLARDSFSKLLATGLSFVVAMQVFVIVGGVTRVIPLTGVTLPFVAYGGSSVVMNFVLLALLLVVSDRARRPYARDASRAERAPAAHGRVARHAPQGSARAPSNTSAGMLTSTIAHAKPRLLMRAPARAAQQRYRGEPCRLPGAERHLLAGRPAPPAVARAPAPRARARTCSCCTTSRSSRSPTGASPTTRRSCASPTNPTGA